MSKRRSLSVGINIFIILLIFGGLLIQIGLFSKDPRNEMIEIPKTKSESIISLSNPDLILQWSFNTSAYTTNELLCGLAVGDGEGDEQLEFAVVGENGTLLSLNGMNGSFLWSYFLSGSAYSVTFGDINADGEDEIISTRRFVDSPIRHNVTAFDFTTHLPISGGYEFTSFPNHYVLGVGAGDIRNNSKDEILFVNSAGDLYVIDGETNDRLKRVSLIGFMIPFGGGSNHNFDINFGDIDNNGVLEFTVCGIDDVITNGSTGLYRWQSGEVTKVWEFFLNTSAYCSTAALGDVDGDGKAEVVAGNRQNDLVAGGDAFLLDGETSDVIWSFTTGANNIYDISLGDIHNDGRDEIAIAVGGTLNSTFILEGENNSVLWQIPSDYAINGVELADVNNDGKCEVITIGKDSVTLYCLDTDGDGLSDMDDPDDDNDNLTDFMELSLYGTNPFILDSDHDNLSDNAELFAHGTNPNWWDTDNDNLSDWMELNYYFTGPNNSNSDGDYLNDGEEILLGLIPTDPDTYDDGFLDSMSYFLDDDTDNLTNHQELNIYSTNPYNPDTDNDNLSDWQELVGSLGYYTNPNSSNSDGDLLSDWEEIFLYNTYPNDSDTYNDGFLDSMSYFLDDDTDNLTNHQELNIYFTNPYDPDTDKDNLSDWQELVGSLGYYTNPNSSNSDGDFLSDWEEIFLYNTDPTDPDSDNDGYLDGQAPENPLYNWLFYLWLGIICATAIAFAMNVRYYYRFKDKVFTEGRPIQKAQSLRKVLKEAVWFWGHGETVLKNFDKLVTKGTTTITLEALTRTWTQHYKSTFKKIFKLSEADAFERAEKQKKKEILELHDLLKDKINIKVVPITFGKHVGSNSYQFEIWSEEPKKSTIETQKNTKQGK